MSATLQMCARCSTLKALDDFHPGKQGKAGHYCRGCCAQYKRERYRPKVSLYKRPKVNLRKRPISMGYRVVHQRIGKMLGPARQRACAQCGNRAHEWAYDHKDPRAVTGVWHGRTVTYSLNPVHYQALCRSCHRRRDGNGRKPLYPKRNGSSRYWRGLRETAAADAKYRCQLRHPEWCIGRAPLHAESGTPAGHLHHTLGRGVTGNDPRYLVWACAPCNLHTADPAKTPDPAPVPRTRW